MSAIGASPLTRPNDRLRRRKVVNRIMEFLAMLAAAIGVAILVIVVYKIVRNGLPATWHSNTLCARFGEIAEVAGRDRGNQACTTGIR